MPEKNSQTNIKNFDAAKLGRFITALDGEGSYRRKSYRPADGKSHYERYNYVCADAKVSIVFDVWANVLSITAPPAVTDGLTRLYAADSAPVQAQQASLAPAPAPPDADSAPAKAKPAAKKRKTAEKKPPEVKKAAEPPPEYKNGLSIKNCPQERFDDFLKQIKTFSGVTVKLAAVDNKGTDKELHAYKITDAEGEKVYARYMPQKKSLQLQGRFSKLSSDVQAAAFKGSDYKTAVSSYIKQDSEHSPDSSASNIERKLKKLIPAAFEYLSEQSKKDFTFALIDINNEQTRLSDYSGLLVSPYRGLERLIYDLQVAQDIKVKMIGQAYEKRDNGQYCLKSGYRKKIGSIIYNEVMSALYQEYFEKRNFYLHSDNSVEAFSPRIIGDKAEAKKIFDGLLEIINYNCAKLREIRFGVRAST
ncbi:MAG: hypothetical protein LBP26_00735 [Clostridiales bacterium]|jgi:hypothetical protein|nr:hypothetical protein [Clostridiales bacterium]